MPRFHWTPEATATLIQLYPTTSNEELAREVGVTSSAVSNRAHVLGLQKCAAYKQRYCVQNGGSGKQHPVTKRCVSCGHTFTVRAYRANTATCCSRACRDRWAVSSGTFKGENNPKYRGGRTTPSVPCICENCNITFLRSPKYLTQKSNGRFCSAACRGAHTARHIKNQRTSIELAIERYLTDCEFNFTSQTPMGPFIMDFYLPRLNLVIECDGDYWHSLPKNVERDARKNNWLTEHRIPFIRLTETDIKANPRAAFISAVYEKWFQNA